MNVARRYAFNLPWGAIAICVVFYGAQSRYIFHLASDFDGVVYVFFIGLSAIFAVLAVIMVTRRLMFPRVLELAEDAILFPRGFPQTRIARIPYADIIRITDSWEHRQAGLSVVTARGDFEITASYLPDIQSYHAARKFIYSQASIVMPPHDQREPSAGTTWGQFPEPILRWVEPEDWPRYRTRLVVSKPLWLRLAKSLWFFVRCFSIFFTPWLLLHFLGGVKPEPAYFCASIFVTLFITYFYH